MSQATTEQPLLLNSDMPLPEQIRAQAGLEYLVIYTAQGVVEITRQQANRLLAGRQLVINPLTRQPEVR
jgi:hypothetical protein